MLKFPEIPKINIDMPTILPEAMYDSSMWDNIKKAADVVINIGEFGKRLFTEPGQVLLDGVHLFQGGAFDLALIILAVILLLKMIGFKDTEKWGIVTIIIYVIIMVL